MYFTVRFQAGEIPFQCVLQASWKHLPVDQIDIFFGNPKGIRPKVKKSKH